MSVDAERENASRREPRLRIEGIAPWRSRSPPTNERGEWTCGGTEWGHWIEGKRAILFFEIGTQRVISRITFNAKFWR